MEWESWNEIIGMEFWNEVECKPKLPLMTPAAVSLEQCVVHMLHSFSGMLETILSSLVGTSACLRAV